MATLLSPRQLGYGVRGGAEVAIHAARKYLKDLPDEHAMVKLDFSAFNSLRRDKMLEAVRDLAPEIYPLVYSAYSSPSTLHWGDHSIHSYLKAYSKEILWDRFSSVSPSTDSILLLL